MCRIPEDQSSFGVDKSGWKIEIIHEDKTICLNYIKDVLVLNGTV